MKTVSYNNDPKLKEDMVEEMLGHQKADALIKGSYSKMNGIFKGCAVGCGVQSLNLKRGLTIKHNDHAGYAEALGIPEWLVKLEDTLFESLPKKESKEFPVKFLKSIPVGVDLEPVKWKFCAFVLKENIERVLRLKIDDKLKEQAISSIQGVLKIHEQAIKSGRWEASAAASAASAAASAARSAAASAAESAWSAAWSAWSAAWSASWSAARSAASAARSTAWSAAWSASWSAANVRYAEELLRLLNSEAR